MKNAIELPEDLLHFAQTQVDKGHYKNVVEVIRDAFSALQKYREKLEVIRDAADIGFGQLDSGDYIEGTPKELMARIRNEAKH